jgi:glycine amidinotransferase
VTSTSAATGVVCSYNEWDPLEEIIVGTVRGSVRSPFEPGFAPFVPLGDPEREFRGGPWPQEEVARAEEQLDRFAALLESRGIVVRRPEPLDHAVRVETPDFVSEAGHGQVCPRDLLIVVGEEIIEAPMAHRCRYFEYRAYRRLLKHYFALGARWTAAPKTTMADASYTPGYETVSRPYDFSTHANLTEDEPYFDAACFSRMGRDIFWQPDIVSNQMGADWLARHLGPTYRVHKVEFHEPFPHHIDATMVPLRPGLVMVNPDRPAKGDCMRVFEDSGWEVVDAVPSAHDTSVWAWGVSKWISMNILSLDEKTVVIDAGEEPFGELLDGLGFDVLPTPFDAVYPFGGSFHCTTTDVRRRGELQSYFPALDAAEGGVSSAGDARAVPARA